MILFVLLALSAEKRIPRHSEIKHDDSKHSSSYHQHKTKKIRRSIDGLIIPEKPVKHRVVRTPRRVSSRKISGSIEKKEVFQPEFELAKMTCARPLVGMGGHGHGPRY